MFPPFMRTGRAHAATKGLWNSLELEENSFGLKTKSKVPLE
jgi:hypothetical protein